MKITKFKVISGVLMLASWYVSMINERDDINEAVEEALDERGLKKPRETRS